MPHAARSRPHCCSLSVLPTAIALGLLSAGAQAQQAPASDGVSQLDTVTVTSSYQKSLITALDNKREDARMTDGISSEDIGKFPAENIAEAIQRIPGVQISTINGRGSTISIRGLGPQYSATTINGQTIKSADFTDGFRYDIIQPEVAAAIEVIKSPSADMDAGGLSGTVNIKTPKPLDYKERKLILSAKEQYSEFAGGAPTPKAVLTYIDQFQLADGGQLGVFVNAGYQKLKDRADYLWIDRWFTQDTDDGTAYIPRRPRYRSIERETDRKMLTAGLQWKPNDRLEMNLTALYSQDKTDNDMNQLVYSFERNALNVLETDGLTATKVSASNYWLENNRQRERHDLTSQLLTWDAKWKGDAWTFSGVANYTEGKTEEDERAVILGRKPTATLFDMSNPGAISLTTDADADDASAWNQANLVRDEYPNGAITKLSNKEWSLQFDAERYVGAGFLDSVKFGTKFRRETFDRNVWRRDFLYLINSGAVSGYAMFPELSAASSGVSNFLDGNLASQSDWVAPDVYAYADALAASGITVPVLFAPQASYHIRNDIFSSYALAKIDTELGSMRLRGNVGVRYENTKRTTNTYLTTASQYSEDANDVVGTARAPYEYHNWLPSLNLVLDMREDLLLRFAAGKVLVRPILDSNTAIASTISSGSNTGGTTTYDVSLGQTDLKALTANQADLGLEWYYGQGGGLTLAGFWKQVKNGTFNSIVCPTTFNGAALSANSSGDCVDGNGNIYEITATQNDPSKVKIKGYELGWTQSFDAWLPIQGFGLTANFTRVIPQRNTDFQIRNLSEKTWNATGYWENAVFSARLSLNHRSEYQQDSSDSFYAREGHTMKARTQLDAVLGYQATDTLSFQLGGLNLTDKKEEAYKDFSSRWQMTGVTGRSFYVSMQWDIL
ncbi:TonB-dependent receptor [Xanthomonas translucens]|uniref:TonB-dependent receptor n=1 Tax=Xanthomonas campestris pv. translucens TaxID=343 RepID=UPI000641C36A|nr:TonB-dependent receptor [Xanthomonas translucens]AKK68824.1 TonB-dependent receptor [Xanthomonas translucens pv. undulosa]MCT8269783.1 TonB-dependent receptor [Xanthomonas translucens pv. undulosa]WNJ32133.1 TonB-dependent receptor [Xanthomonas translucens pv. undulosa]